MATLNQGRATGIRAMSNPGALRAEIAAWAIRSVMAWVLPVAHSATVGAPPATTRQEVSRALRAFSGWVFGGTVLLVRSEQRSRGGAGRQPA